MILGLLAGAWARFQGWILGAAVLLASLGAIYLAGRRGGSAEAEVRALRRALGQRETRDAVDRDVARTGDAAERLRRDWSRD